LGGLPPFLGFSAKLFSLIAGIKFLPTFIFFNLNFILSGFSFFLFKIIF